MPATATPPRRRSALPAAGGVQILTPTEAAKAHAIVDKIRTGQSKDVAVLELTTGAGRP